MRAEEFYNSLSTDEIREIGKKKGEFTDDFAEAYSTHQNKELEKALIFEKESSKRCDKAKCIIIDENTELSHQNKKLIEALMETDLYYRAEVKIPNVRICKINFDLLNQK